MTTLTIPYRAVTTSTPAGAVQRTPVPDAIDEFAGAVLDSVVGRRGGAFSVSVPSDAEAVAISSRIEVLLMTVRMGTGSVSARVAPRFLEDTYPAMLSLARALDDAGLGGLWNAEGGRSMRLMEAWQLFISVDTPTPRTRTSVPDRPDTLLEVIGADRVPTDWYRSRVAPRSSAKGLTTVFYGPPSRPAPGTDSLFDRVRRSNLTKEWRDGVKRHFDATEIQGAADGSERTGR